MPRSSADGTFEKPDEIIDLTDEPDHQELCAREQRFFRRCDRRGPRPRGPHGRRREQPAHRAGRGRVGADGKNGRVALTLRSADQACPVPRRTCSPCSGRTSGRGFSRRPRRRGRAAARCRASGSLRQASQSRRPHTAGGTLRRPGSTSRQAFGRGSAPSGRQGRPGSVAPESRRSMSVNRIRPRRSRRRSTRTSRRHTGHPPS